ncbi:MAG: winged helix-turn-helix domain-containing protein [Woeseiaceae bacterium]|nr:winged helix-turn-helix domain-containing protein [Woeseiaceae bacterium]
MYTNDELYSGFVLGDFIVWPAKGLVERGRERVQPEPKVFEVLLTLARRDGNLVTKEALIDECWDGKAFSDEPVLRCISLLRGHFGDQKPYRYIETLPRRGYRLLQPVELVEPPAVEPVTPPTHTVRSARRWRLAAVVFALGLVVVGASTWLTSRSPEDSSMRSIAILPVDNLSDDPENAFIAEGLRNAVAARLSELNAFSVKNAFEEYDAPPDRVARRLRVESVLVSSLQRQRDELQVTWLIVRASDGVTIASGQVLGSLGEFFDLQEDLAVAVRDELAGPETPQLIEQYEPDSAAYNSYMRGRYALEHRLEKGNLEEAVRLFSESIRLDERYGPAYLGLATAYALMPDYLDADLDRYLQLAIETIEKGIEMDPTILDPAGAIYGFVYYQRKEWDKAEANYRRAVGATVVDSNAFSWYSQMLANVGRMEESLSVAFAGEAVYPDSTIINSRIAMVHTWLGNGAEANEYFARANDLDATGIIHVMAQALLMQREGQADKSRELTLAAAGMEGAPSDWVDPVYRGLGDPHYAADGLAALDAIWEQGRVIPHIALLARTLLGDIDGAMEVAGQLDEQPGEYFSMEILFIDELAPLRAHRNFMPLLERVGVVEHWKNVGCAWSDDRLRCPD